MPRSYVSLARVAIWSPPRNVVNRATLPEFHRLVLFCTGEAGVTEEGAGACVTDVSLRLHWAARCCLL
jgi:hypothetical protein